MFDWPSQVILNEEDIVFDHEDSHGVIIDPLLYQRDPQAAKEREIRPREYGIIQIQMDNLYSYSIWIYPNIMHEFEDYELFRRCLLKYVKDEELVERAATCVANFKLVNIDLKEKVAYAVLGYGRIA
jgi:hypothetical protein